MSKTFDDALNDLQFAMLALGLNKTEGVSHATVYMHSTSVVCIDSYLLVSVVKRALDRGFTVKRTEPGGGTFYLQVSGTYNLVTFGVEVSAYNVPTDVQAVLTRLLAGPAVPEPEPATFVPVVPPGAGKVASMDAAVAAVEADGGTAVVLERQPGKTVGFGEGMFHTVVEERGDVVLPVAPAVAYDDDPAEGF